MRADFRAVDHGGSHADQRTLADVAAVHDRPMPDGHLVADASDLVVVHVDAAVFLHVGLLSDFDATAEIAADGCALQDGALGVDRNVADHRGRGRNVRSGVDRKVFQIIHGCSCSNFAPMVARGAGPRNCQTADCARKRESAALPPPLQRLEKPENGCKLFFPSWGMITE